MGPLSAAQVLVSWSHAGRLRSEAAFAALAGTNPIPASSGQVTRYRLNRGGDRQLNRALHTILLVRLRADPDTRAYMARRTAEGKSRRDAKRCLRRVIARQLFRLLRLDNPGVKIPGGRPAQRPRNRSVISSRAPVVQAAHQGGHAADAQFQDLLDQPLPRFGPPGPIQHVQAPLTLVEGQPLRCVGIQLRESLSAAPGVEASPST